MFLTFASSTPTTSFSMCEPPPPPNDIDMDGADKSNDTPPRDTAATCWKNGNIGLGSSSRAQVMMALLNYGVRMPGSTVADAHE
ncbi:hypothetical protein H2248_007050 [Termitomyces sp. 'cryptogamus']|nr:hypothetical protein H2248_007050 [Termitomyces sp. 'cryptogamus']